MTTTIKRYEWRGWGHASVEGIGYELVPEAAAVVIRNRGISSLTAGYWLDISVADDLPTHVYADSSQHLAETLRLPEWVASYLFQEMGTYQIVSVEQTVTLGGDFADNSPQERKRERQEATDLCACGVRYEGQVVQNCATPWKHDAYVKVPEPDYNGIDYVETPMHQGCPACHGKDMPHNRHCRARCPTCHGKDGYHYQSCEQRPYTQESIPSPSESAVGQAPSATPRVRVYCKTDSPEEGENL